MEKNNEDNTMTCNYECCNPNIKSKKDALQNIKLDSISYFLNCFKDVDELYLPDLVEFRNGDPEHFKLLEKSNVNSIISVPLKIGGEIYGFLGIDNPRYSCNDFTIVRTVSIYIYSAILRRMKTEEEQKINSAVLNTLAEDYTTVLFIDVKRNVSKPYRLSSRVEKKVKYLVDVEYDYENSYQKYVNEVVLEDDRQMMISFGMISNLCKKLSYRKNVKKQYRAVINGQIEYFQAKWVKIGEENEIPEFIVLAFENIGEQVRNAQIINEQKKEIEIKQQQIDEVTEKINEEKTKSQMDKLTGLYDKISGQYLIERYAKEKRKEESYALFFIDIDHFKTFNDDFGHLVGDEVLITVGNVIKSVCRNDDIAVRFGGDEFLILLKNIELEDVVKGKAVSIKNKLNSFSETKEFTISCSIGVAITKSDVISEAVKCADDALYYVKNTTRNAVKIIQI